MITLWNGHGQFSGSAIAADAMLSLLDLAARSALLLLATAVAAWLLRRRSAAIRHRIWTLGFCGCLVIPSMTYLAPLGTLPIIPDRFVTSDERTAEPIAGQPAPATPVSTTPAGFETSVPADFSSRTHAPSDAVVVDDMQEATLPTQAAVPPAAPAGESHRNRTPTVNAPSWPLAILVTWLAGVVVLALRIGRQHWVLGRLLRSSRPMDSGDWRAAAAEASRALGFSRPVRLVRSSETQTPAVAGIFSTTVILPRDADAWSPQRRRYVLLHELGHAQRGDVLTHAIARLVTTLHWFNPLCWLGLIQMGRLRELACDDLVLTSGQPATDYADVLLDVARSYRHRSLGMAVGMARRADVEDRIAAILDQARNRVTLSPKAARRWLLMTLAIVALLGSLRMSTSAEPDADGSDSVQDSAVSDAEAADPDLRTMTVRITDDDGNPLEKASLHVSDWEIEGAPHRFPNRNFLTNADGIAEFMIPRRLSILRLWPAKDGYAPEFVNFGEGTHDEGLLIPDRYEFQLTQGTQLSGTVVDEEGKPVSGVKVEVLVEVDEPAWTTNPKPMTSTWLTDSDFNSEAPVTDAEGKWSISNAPPPLDGKDYEFRLKHTHPNYVKDSSWGELQGRQGVTTAMLRDGTAKIVLTRGVAVKGTVVDSEGRPVTEGLVVWSNRPYWAEDVNEVAIDADGRFETLPLAPGEYPMTVMAPGSAPLKRRVTVAKGMDSLQFELPPGNRLVMRIVDSAGKTIANASVGIDSWRGSESIYNHHHPNVPESGIPRYADGDGVYVWDWAPDDEVTYQVWAKGYASNEVSLIANGTEHVVELSRELVAAGRVTDAQTGATVEDFRVTPVWESRPHHVVTRHHHTVRGAQGEYQVVLDDTVRENHRYLVRIDAPGYRSALSEQSFTPTDGHVEANFELEPAPARPGRIVDAQGRPVANASIVVATPSDVPMMHDGGLRYGNDRKTGPDGAFELPATFEPVRIRATDESGIVEVLRQPDEEVGTLQLEPWATISGRLVDDGLPFTNRHLDYTPFPLRHRGEARFQDSYHAQFDNDGRFEFKRIPPGRGRVEVDNKGQWMTSPLLSLEAVPVQLNPGEHRELVLAGGGVTVKGRADATGRTDVEWDQHASLNYLIRRDAPDHAADDFPTLSFNPSEPIQTNWLLDPQFNAWLTTRPHHRVKLATNGEFTVPGVSPGQYDLVLRLFDRPPDCLFELVGARVIPIEITPDDVAAGMLNLGRIDVACISGPRIGEKLQAYESIDASGRLRKLQELQQQYVLLHVWSSRSAPCLEQMPELQATVAAWRSRPIIVAGLNIDADRTRAEALVRQNNWNWAQFYLGENSEAVRQLALFAAPTYYLIGPDGRLAACSNDWTAIRDHFESVVGAKPE